MLRAYAQTRVLFGLNVLRLVIVAALIGWFLSAFGLLGAVLVMLLATALVRAAAVVRIARLMGVGVARLLPWRAGCDRGLARHGGALPAMWFARALIAAAAGGC